MMHYNKLLLLIITTWCITTPIAAFMVQPSSSQQQRNPRARSYSPASASTSPRSRLMVVADAEQEEKSKQRHNRDGDRDDDDNGQDWVPTATGGWFSPYLSRRLGREQPPEQQQQQAQPQSPTSPPSTVTAPPASKPSKKKNQLMSEVKTMQEYKDQVVDEQDSIVCVRFYAPWCRACKAVEAPYRQLATQHSSAPESETIQKVKFVQVPLTKENAYLHTGLGIPSLPFAHIYHPVAGLVEERSINKKIFGEFKDALQTYVDGECAIDWDSENGNTDSINNAAQVEESLQ